MDTIIDAIVIYHINNFEQKPSLEYKIFNLPKIEEIITPFNQSYKYMVKSISNNGRVCNIYLCPYCKYAKEVFNQQYKKS